MPALDKEGVCLSVKEEPGKTECGLFNIKGFLDAMGCEDAM